MKFFFNLLHLYSLHYKDFEKNSFFMKQFLFNDVI